LSDPGPPWRLHVTPRARRDIRQLDPPVRRRILDALDQLAADPRTAPLRRLTGGPELRLRVGDWQVRLELDTDERIVVIHRVLPRGRAYDR
jgi:mRNA interferase RelE/StbE